VDRVPENAAEHASHSSRALATAAAFELPQNGQAVRWRDLRDRPSLQRRIGHVEQPTDLAQRDGGEPFIDALSIPLLRNRAERVGCGNLGGQAGLPL